MNAAVPGPVRIYNSSPSRAAGDPVPVKDGSCESTIPLALMTTTEAGAPFGEATASETMAAAQPAPVPEPRRPLQCEKGFGSGFKPMTSLIADASSSVPGPVTEWEDGWALPVDVVQQPGLVQRPGLNPSSSASTSDKRGHRGRDSICKSGLSGGLASRHRYRDRGKYVRTRGTSASAATATVKALGNREEMGWKQRQPGMV